MSVETFRLRGMGQSDYSLSWHQVVGEILRVIVDLSKIVVAHKKGERRVYELEISNQMAAPIRVVALPFGYVDRACPECGSDSLTGALLSPDADESDPNVFCHSCCWVN